MGCLVGKMDGMDVIAQIIVGTVYINYTDGVE